MFTRESLHLPFSPFTYYWAVLWCAMFRCFYILYSQKAASAAVFNNNKNYFCVSKRAWKARFLFGKIRMNKVFYILKDHFSESCDKMNDWLILVQNELIWSMVIHAHMPIMPYSHTTYLRVRTYLYRLAILRTILVGSEPLKYFLWNVISESQKCIGNSNSECLFLIEFSKHKSCIVFNKRGGFEGKEAVLTT